MAIYKKGEFAKLCGVGNSAITNAIKRYQLVDKNGRIDTSIPTNYDYMMVARARNGMDSESIPDNPASVISKMKAIEKPPAKKTVTEKTNDSSTYDLERKKKLADIEKKQVDIRIALLTEQKLKGESIPTSIVKEIITQMSKSFIETYRDSSEQFVINIAHKNRLTADQSAEMKGELIRMINKSHDDAISEAQAALKAIVQQIVK